MGNDPVQGCEFWSLVESVSRDGLYWAFAVIQNPTQLAAWSDRIKAYVPVFPVVEG
jgi:hypothetical protein